MKVEISEIVEILESLTEDSPHKVKIELVTVINMMKGAKTVDDFIDVQEQLEYIANINNIDACVSTEVYNAISVIETLI